MSRNIPNKPHPTPNPDKPHSPSTSDRSHVARPVGSPQASAGQAPTSSSDDLLDDTAYDSCFDDLDQVLSQSIQQPDPDPNLESLAAQASAGPEGGVPSSPRGKPPRTSEIFRSVVSTGGPALDSSRGPDTAIPPVATPGEPEIPELGVASEPLFLPAGEANDDGTHPSDARVPWGQILLLSYSSAITLALIWMFATGRFPGAVPPAPAAPARPAAEAPTKAAEPLAPLESPPLPAENLTTIGRSLRLGDLEVTPIGIIASPLHLVRTIDPDRRRRADDCLILRLRFTNHSKDQTFAPLERNLVRERELRPHDPYIETSNGPGIRFFPLAVDSEWSIKGQTFPVLRPGESGETFVAAEPDAANRLADGEMTWRVRVRIGTYRTDMLGVRFTRDQVQFLRRDGERPRASSPEEGDEAL